MNKLMMVVAMLFMAIAMTGCGTLEAEWGGETAITDKDGAPIVVNGVVQKIKQPNKFYSHRVGLDTKIDTGNMNVTKDGYSVGLNGYASDVSPENAKMITATGDAIANITGRAIAAAMTAGISEITGQAIPAVQSIASQYISAGGSFVPTITVKRDATGKIAEFTISDGRVTQTGSIVCSTCTDVNPGSTTNVSSATSNEHLSLPAIRNDHVKPYPPRREGSFSTQFKSLARRHHRPCKAVSFSLKLLLNLYQTV